MTDDNDVYTPAQYREHQDGYGVRDPEAHDHAGIVRDEQVSRYLSVVAETYDPTAPYVERDGAGPLPGHAADLEEVSRPRRMAATETARNALDHGDMPTLKHLTGDQQQRADVSGLKAIDQLTQAVTGPAAMFYLWAEPGSGKTNFSLLLAQLWKRQRSSDALLGSNIRTLRETDEWTSSDGEKRDGWLPSFGDLQEWLQQDGDPLTHDQRPKLFIFDEASSSAGGTGANGYNAKEKMGPLAYKIRKYGGSLIVIGHDGKDVHPLIRELGVAIHKDGKKEATFYDDVQNRKGVGERFRVDGIPPTDYRYNDKEPTAWSWSENEHDDDLDATDAADDVDLWTVRECYQAGVSAREAAKFVRYSRDWTTRRYRWIKDDEFPHERADRAQEQIA